MVGTNLYVIIPGRPGTAAVDHNYHCDRACGWSRVRDRGLGGAVGTSAKGQIQGEDDLKKESDTPEDEDEASEEEYEDSSHEF